MIEIPKGSGRGTWRSVRAGSSVRLTCPACGFDAELDHEIARDGTVTPSVECPNSCGFHEHIKLKDWR
jgi:uncharacterized Zn finger protein